MENEKIDVHVQIAWDLADSALEEAQAANDMLSLLVGALMKTQPEVASELRRSLKALLESKDHLIDGPFANNARRLCSVLEGKHFHLDSLYPPVGANDLERLKRQAFFRRGMLDPD